MKNPKPSKTPGESQTHTHVSGSAGPGKNRFVSEAISTFVSKGETTSIIIPREFVAATKGRQKRATSRKK